MDPKDKFFEPDIAPLVCGTFLCKEMQENHCFPQVRHQKTTGNSGTCAHCSLCPCIESRNKLHWYSNDPKKWLKYCDAKVDVEFLIKVEPPPTHPLTIVQTVIEKHSGQIPAQKKKLREKIEMPFAVKGYKYIHLSKIEGVKEKFHHIKPVFAQLAKDGPAVGGYLVSELPKYLKKSETQVYIPEQQLYVQDETDGTWWKGYHGVCLVGMGLGNYEGKLELFFQILDSNIHSSKNDDGVKFVPGHSLDSILLPKVKMKERNSKKKVDEKEEKFVSLEWLFS